MSRRVSDEAVETWPKLPSSVSDGRVQFAKDLYAQWQRFLIGSPEHNAANNNLCGGAVGLVRDLLVALAAAEQQIAGAKRDGMVEAAKIADAFANRPSVDAVRRAGAMEVTALIRAALPPAPSDVAEPGATETICAAPRPCRFVGKICVWCGKNRP